MFKTINTLAIAVSLSLLGFTQAQAGLLAHWKFDEGSGTSVADSSSNSNTGTLTNMTGNEWTTGPVGGALNFDGVDDYILVNYDSSLDATSALTISAWVKTSTSNSQAELVVNKMKHNSGTATDDSYAMRIQNGAVAVQASAGAASSIWVPGSLVVNDGQWHHLAYVFDKPTSYLYVDGLFDSGGTYPAMNSNLNNSAHDLYIGGSNNNGTPANFFTGIIDDLRIYDSALTAAQIQALVPEPSTALLLCLGLLALATGRWNR
jgi:hypothetical protein